MSRGTVLIVEDEAIVAADLASKLERLGYEVMGSAQRGEDAVALVRSSAPDIILMDVRLQGELDGVEAAATIRSQCARPVVYLTAHSDAGTLGRAKLTEPFGYLLKPFEERELEITLEIALHKHKIEDRLRTALAQLSKANEELETKVEQRTSKLRETVADLEQFSYSIAHDLRAPLRAMSSFSSILVQDYDHDLDPKASEYLRRIKAAAMRMDLLIQDVLSYSEVVRGEARVTKADLDQLIHEVMEHYPQLAREDAAITVRSPLFPVLGNPVLLMQCISNLLDNALTFVAPGVRPQISLWTEEHGGKIRFCVQDNGVGIKPAQIERIWRIFEVGHSDRALAGTGIGLSLVKRAVERMGGTVGVESMPGQGSLFWFELAKA